MPTVISFALGAVATFGGSYMAMSNRLVATETKLDESRKSTDERIDRLTQQVEKHNNLVERVAVLERDMSTAFKRHDENLERIERLEQV